MPEIPTHDLIWPMASLAFWTLDIITYLELKRAYALWKGQVKLDDFRIGETANVPTELVLIHRNYRNLLESPILFYAACLLALAIGRVDGWMAGLAWTYVAIRVAHSVVHIDNRFFVARIVLFSVSLLLLALMWGKLALGL